jgi:hypothetical protein
MTRRWPWVVCNIPVACNRSTAEFMTSSLLEPDRPELSLATA